MKGRKGDDRGVRRYREMGLCVTAHDCVRLRALLRECGEALEYLLTANAATWPEHIARLQGIRTVLAKIKKELE